MGITNRSRRSVLCSAIVGALMCSAAVATASAETVLEGKTIRILAIGDPVFQAMQKIHSDLEKMAGGKIELDVKPFDVLRQQVLLNAQNAESNYDIIAVDLPQFGEYKPFLRDLNPRISEDKFDSSDFHQIAWTGAQFSGQQLGIPLQPHPEILAYRKDLLDAAGLQPPKTIEELLAAAKTLHNPDKGIAGMCWNAARGTALGQTYIMMMGSFGQAPIDLPKSGNGFAMDNIQPANMKPMIDTPAGLATAKYLQELTKYSPPDILNMAWDERTRVFGQGGCAMTYIWSGGSAAFELDDKAPAHGKVGYTVSPGGNGSPALSTLGGWYLSVPTNLPDDKVPLAWDVIKWLTSPDMMVEYTKHGNCVAPRHSVSNNTEVTKRCPNIPAVDAMAAAGQLAGWQRPPVPEVQKIVDVVGTEMHAVISGQATPEDAVRKSQELIDREMRKAGYY